MGMYDEIICKCLISGGLPTWISKHPFQTKDLDCELTTYHIEADGSFSKSGWTGLLSFYTSNVVGTGPGIYTENGEDAEYLDCEAKIVDGYVVGDIKVTRTSHKAWPSSKMSIFSKPTEEEVKRWRERQAESLIGKRLYVLWGGETSGYWVNVIAENDKQLCVRHESNHKFYKAGDFELLDRRERDHIFWDTKAEALERDKKRKDDWNRQKAEFETFKKR